MRGEHESATPATFSATRPGSDERDAEYEALNDADPAQLPDSDPGKADGSYRPAVVDKPVTDAMEKGGQDQRLLLSLVILAGELGAFMLLGALSVGVLLSQVIVLLLACFAPVALVAAVIPGRGHHAFKAWAARLASYLVRKAAYSLVLAVILAVLAALQDATSNLGWLMSFGLQALLLWTVYLQRHALTAQLIGTVTGHQPERDAQLRRLLGLRYAARAITPAARRRPAAVMRPSRDPDHPAAPPDEHTASAPGPAPAVAPPATGFAGQPVVESVVDRERRPRRVPRDRPVTEPDAPSTIIPSHFSPRTLDAPADFPAIARATAAGSPDDPPAQPAAAGSRAAADPRPTLGSSRAVTAASDHPLPTRDHGRGRTGARSDRAAAAPAEPAPTERSLADELRADPQLPASRPSADAHAQPPARATSRERRSARGPGRGGAR